MMKLLQVHEHMSRHKSQQSALFCLPASLVRVQAIWSDPVSNGGHYFTSHQQMPRGCHQCRARPMLVCPPQLIRSNKSGLGLPRPEQSSSFSACMHSMHSTARIYLVSGGLRVHAQTPAKHKNLGSSRLLHVHSCPLSIFPLSIRDNAIVT